MNSLKSKFFGALCLGMVFWLMLIPGLQAQDVTPAETPDALESETAPPNPPFEKNMVVVPPISLKLPVDASDFRDPFYLIRENREDPKKVLIPGTTVDGIRFNSYSESKGFIENFYRDSNFSLDNIFSNIRFVNKEGGCLTCHRGIEEISENHQFRCTTCHRGSLRGKTVKSAHRGMVPNPSDKEHAPKTCGKCHADQIEKVERSLMAKPRGIVDLTRYAWGFSRPEITEEVEPEEAEEPGEENTGEGETPPLTETLPEEPVLETTEVPLQDWTYNPTDHRVDDFMNKKCLRCHIDSGSPHRAGDYRGTGCASCHMVYSNDGLTLTRDRAVQERQKREILKKGSRFDYATAAGSLTNRRGYPVLHKFTVAIPSVQCEHCHNNNGVGNEYEGLFAKPQRPHFINSKVQARQPVLYGRQHEFLLPDIHREKGMHCIDCHGIEEVKADATQHATMHDAVTIRCETCHGTTTEPPQAYQLVESDSLAQALIKSNRLNPNLKNEIEAGDVVMAGPDGKPMPHILKDKENWILISKLTGTKHIIPLVQDLEKAPNAHQIESHMAKVECSACHARWSVGEYGLHVIREEQLKPGKWKDWTFADPVLQSLLASSETDPTATQKGMLNWNNARRKNGTVQGTWTPGVWLDIVTDAGWTQPILGINRRGKVSAMKPRYPYFVTDFMNGEDTPPHTAVLKTDDHKPALLWTAYTPHTIRTSTRTCESCHQNDQAMGLGDPGLYRVEDGEGFITEWMETSRVTPEFQPRQTLTQEGIPLQTAVSGSRFLNLDELNTLQTITDRYRAWFYRDIRGRGMARLLVREVFPFDQKHEINEQQFGDPLHDENLTLYSDPSKKLDTETVPAELNDSATPPVEQGADTPQLPYETWTP